MKVLNKFLIIGGISIFSTGCISNYTNINYIAPRVQKIVEKPTSQTITEIIKNDATNAVSSGAKDNDTLAQAARVINSIKGIELEGKSLEDFIKNLEVNFKKVLSALNEKVAQKWGLDNTQSASQDTFVKYTDSYLSRAKVDFTNGKISVETLDSKNPKKSLKNAIVTTLLTPEDPESVDLYSDKAVSYTSKPYLANLVKDNENQPVLYQWRANKYATYLVENKLQTKEIVENGQKKQVHFVEFEMVSDHEIQSEHKYAEFVAKYSKQYNLDQALIFAIIKTESSFNPYAVSHIPAYGLMQVVPASAGRDVYRALNNKDGIPTKEMLFTPQINIQYGSAYLDILFNRYIKGVKNALSHEYCVIAAYNTGSGNVLSVFDKDRTKAVSVINTLTSAEVYRRLRVGLKYEEARNYLHKVTNAKKEFQAGSGGQKADSGILQFKKEKLSLNASL